MLEDQDGEFILSIFLMEAWDTVAAVEEGVRRLAAGEPVSSVVLNPLMVVAHRLKGAAALHGYPVVSAVALVLEEKIEEIPAAPDGERPRRIEVLADVVATVKRMLKTIGDDGREDVDAVAHLRARHPELFSPPAPADPFRGPVRHAGPGPAATPGSLPATPPPPPPPASPPSLSPPSLPPPSLPDDRVLADEHSPAGGGAASPDPAVAPAPPEAPRAPLEEAAAEGLLRELERFFAEHAESVPYFAPEAAEHLDVMARSLLALEQSGSPAQEEVASLFRAVHTLKGAAYTVGCTPVGDVAHRIEDLLEGVRDGRLSLSPAVIEAVFGGVDALRLLLGSASVTSPSVRAFVQRTLDTLDALRLLAGTAVDAVITDLEMPRISGYELIEDLRSRASTRALPVVVLTTRAGAKHVNLARRLGITHYVTKPVDEGAFVRLIVSLTARRAGLERTEARS